MPAAPAHDGAQAWFDGFEPSLVQENAEPPALVVTVFPLMVSIPSGHRPRASLARENRPGAQNIALLAAGETARRAGPDGIGASRERHFAILAGVVVALDADGVTEEGFRPFSLRWKGVRGIVDEQRTELRQTTVKGTGRSVSHGAHACLSVDAACV